MEECSLILVSNAEFSSTLYPSNTVAKFTTRLCRPVEMRAGGTYEIAVTKIQFPISFHNVNEKDFFVTEYLLSEDDDGEDVKSEFKTVTLPKGNYSDLKQLLHYLNKLTVVKNNLALDYNEDSGRVEVVWSGREGRKMVDLSPKLRAMLGFKPTGEEFLAEGPAPNPVHLYANVHQQLFVYCDVVEPQLVGDSSERVLCTVGIEDVTRFGYLFKQRYINPDYIPLLKTNFDTIEIDIRTYEDLPAPFEYGPSLVKVHIRRAAGGRR
jgi:hypothetical protein